MNVVFSKPPAETERRLQAKYPETWEFVCIGKTRQIVSISEYVNREKFAAITGVLTEMLDRQDARPYKGIGRKLYIERMARKIIEI